MKNLIEVILCFKHFYRVEHTFQSGETGWQPGFKEIFTLELSLNNLRRLSRYGNTKSLYSG